VPFEMPAEEFQAALAERKRRVYHYLKSGDWARHFRPSHVCDAVFSYLDQGGKGLRPGILLFACGAVGGDEETALPAAAAVEVYHTWTLVHDDVIDRDDARRGRASVHVEFSRRGGEELGLARADAEHYGTSIAILAGDVQQGWTVSLLSELARNGVDAHVVLALIRRLSLDVQTTLLEGQTLDIRYSKQPPGALDQDQILGMLWKKTGALYQYAAESGALIGLGTADFSHPLAGAVGQFASKCGTAFQLQDDILGLVGDEQKLGKPVGSDIREGKRTLVFHVAFRRADARTRERLAAIVGNEDATPAEIEEAKRIIVDLGGVEETQALARSYVDRAFEHLDLLPDSKHKDLLAAWGRYLIARTF
jgi:geranylgeranyl diphosphate synthase type I